VLGHAEDNFLAEWLRDLCKLDCPQFVWTMIDHRLAPEDPFPAGLNDCMDALRFLVRSNDLSEKYKYHQKRVHLWGESAGGGLVASMAYSLFSGKGGDEDVARSLLSVWTNEPMLDPRCNSESYKENWDVRLAPPAWLEWCWKSYLGNLDLEKAVKEGRICPHLHQLSPTSTSLPLFVVGSGLGDALRDDARAYVETLRTSGATVTHVEAGGSHVLCWSVDKDASARLKATLAELLQK